MEALEDGLAVLIRNPDAGVRDGERERRCVQARRERDAAAVGRELDRVAAEVGEDLAQFISSMRTVGIASSTSTTKSSLRGLAV